MPATRLKSLWKIRGIRGPPRGRLADEFIRSKFQVAELENWALTCDCGILDGCRADDSTDKQATTRIAATILTRTLCPDLIQRLCGIGVPVPTRWLD